MAGWSPHTWRLWWIWKTPTKFIRIEISISRGPGNGLVLVRIEHWWQWYSRIRTWSQRLYFNGSIFIGTKWHPRHCVCHSMGKRQRSPWFCVAAAQKSSPGSCRTKCHFHSKVRRQPACLTTPSDKSGACIRSELSQSLFAIYYPQLQPAASDAGQTGYFRCIRTGDRGIDRSAPTSRHLFSWIWCARSTNRHLSRSHRTQPPAIYQTPDACSVSSNHRLSTALIYHACLRNVELSFGNVEL